MKISIVIPVYNEAESLGACLRAIAGLEVSPYEVIVVDNNSTDDSPAIAKGFDYVTYLMEPKQGVIHARTTGFDHATGDIIARIDADSIIPSDWTRRLVEIFDDPQVDAVTGAAKFYDLYRGDIVDSADLYFRQKLHKQLGNRTYLWGANMAIRRQAWNEVSSKLCVVGGIHEDFDLAIHLQELGGRIGFEPTLIAGVSPRRIDTGYIEFLKYIWRSPHTYAEHRITQRYHMYPVIALAALAYFPVKLMRRGYDQHTNSLKLSRLLRSNEIITRVDPTSNVA